MGIFFEWCDAIKIFVKTRYRQKAISTTKMINEAFNALPSIDNIGMMFSRNVGVSEREISVHHRTRISCV